jgi:uncharacterized protein (TIGR02246 family)
VFDANMPARTSEAASDAFRAAINAGDVPAALELWVEDATIVQADGTLATGRMAIAAALAALVEGEVELEIEILRMITAGDVAVAVAAQTMRGRGADGERFEQRGDATIIYRRGADGSWRLAIDAPWGLPRQ